MKFLSKTSSKPTAAADAYMSSPDVERALTARYLARIFQRRDLTARSLRSVTVWAYEYASNTGVNLPDRLNTLLEDYYSSSFDHRALELLINKERPNILEMLNKAAAEAEPPEPLAGNTRTLVEALKLPHADATWKLVGLVACCTRYDQVNQLTHNLTETTKPLTRAIAMLIDEPVRLVEDLIQPTSELIASGLIQLQEDSEYLAHYNGRLKIPNRVDDALDRKFDDFNAMRNMLLGNALQSVNTADDFEHVAIDRDILAQVLKGASREGARGINVLIYGPPGSGKTEMAKIAANLAGLSLYAAGEDVANASESGRADRLGDLVFAQRLSRDQPGAALMFDEMEDVAVHLIKRGG
ncbi:MAG: AAA family ATPase, partial [Pseudomonadota bacterium]